jgi:F-type H+-transporting ATPase subunit delta
VASSTRASKIAAEQALAEIGSANLNTAAELFAIANALQLSKQLRLLLSDPSAEAKTKDEIVAKVFGPKVSSESLALMMVLAKLRWSKTRDLPAALEELGVRVIAQNAESMEALQAQIFQVQQLVSSDPELELALANTRATVAQKQLLIHALTFGKINESAQALVQQGLESKSFKRYADVLEQFSKWLARFAGESVAHIRVAHPLSASQLERLGEALNKSFGKKLQLNVELDKEIIGGVHISVNGVVIDQTVGTKLNQARLQLS